MSMWLPEGGVAAPRRSHPKVGPDPLGIGLAVAVVGLGGVLVFWEARFRVLEARFSALVLSLTHLRSARSLGTNVVFPLRGHWVGYTLTVGCTAALMLLPFFLIAAGLLAAGRVNRRRALMSLGVVSVIILAVNQLRFMVIAGSMVAWGFRVGYERSHILLGTVLSTLGVILGVIAFVWMLIDNPRTRPSTAKP